MRVIVGALLALSLQTQAGEFDNPITPEVECLTQNIYHEARGESLVGQLAVGFVTHNRVNDRRYPNTYCGVIRDGYNPSRKDCQFSWYCDGRPDTAFEKDAWETAQMIAMQVIYNHDYIIDPTNGATHYHSLKVMPWWASKLSYNGAIDSHLFYVEGDPSERNRSKQ